MQGSRDNRPPRWLHPYAVLTAAATCVLIFVGGLVTSTGSGLAVPDWPLSFGQVFPPMVGGVVFEHGHRMVATFVGLLTIGLAVALSRWEPRAWVRHLGWLALGAVVVQGALGGVTVLLKLPVAVSVAHACLAQAFFCLVVSIAVFTGRAWAALAQRSGSVAPSPLRPLAALTTAAVFCQLLLGALMRHMGAGLAIPDFPLAFGRLVPPVFPAPVLVHFSHRLGAAVVAALVTAMLVIVIRHHRRDAALRRPAAFLASLVVAQIGLGALTIWSWRAVLPTTAHVAVGALILATSVVLALRAAVLLGRRSQARVQVRPMLSERSAT